MGRTDDQILKKKQKLTNQKTNKILFQEFGISHIYGTQCLKRDLFMHSMSKSNKTTRVDEKWR